MIEDHDRRFLNSLSCTNLPLDSVPHKRTAIKPQKAEENREHKLAQDYYARISLLFLHISLSLTLFNLFCSYLCQGTEY